MEIQEIEVVIDRAGKIQLKVHGMQGMACVDATAELERLLGHVEQRQLTTEAYGPPQTVDVEQQTRD